MIEIATNASEAAAQAAGVATRTMTKAFAHSANGTILQTRTFILKALVEAGIKRKYGSAALQNQRATPDFLNAKLLDKGRKLPLAAFSPRAKRVMSARGRRTGVTIILGGTRQLVAGAFLATTKSGNVGIFRRVGQDRLPIAQVYGAKIIDLYQGISGLPSSTKTFAQATFQRLFARDFEFYKAREKR